MRSYWCLVLCVVKVISCCYVVDMVTCCLIIRYSQLKLESSFPPICYLILICSVCNVIYLFTVFIYLFIIIFYQLGLPHSSTLVRCSVCNCPIFCPLFPEKISLCLLLVYKVPAHWFWHQFLLTISICFEVPDALSPFNFSEVKPATEWMSCQFKWRMYHVRVI